MKKCKQTGVSRSKSVRSQGLVLPMGPFNIIANVAVFQSLEFSKSSRGEMWQKPPAADSLSMTPCLFRERTLILLGSARTQPKNKIQQNKTKHPTQFPGPPAGVVVNA